MFVSAVDWDYLAGTSLGEDGRKYGVAGGGQAMILSRFSVLCGKIQHDRRCCRVFVSLC